MAKRTVELEFIIDDKTAEQKLSNIEKSTAKTASAFSKAGSMIKLGFAAVAGSAIFDVIGGLDKLNTQMQSNERRAETVFGEMSDDAKRWADANNEAFGAGENRLLGMAAAVQDLLVPMGFAREEAFGLTKEVLTTANALSEWTGGSIEAADAQDRLIKAILGEREGLIPLGIKISELDVKNRLAAKGQAELTGQALEQAKAQATLELITEKSADALHAYTGRAGSAIAQMKELQATTEDTQETWADLLSGPIAEGKKTFGDLANIAKFLSTRTGELADESDPVVQIWKEWTPVGGILVGLLHELGGAAEEATEPTIGIARASRQAADAQEDAAFAARDYTDALQEQADAEKALLDPTFAVINAHNTAERALRKYIEAVNVYGVGSEEAEAAAIDLAEANLRLDSSARKFALEGGQAGIDAIVATMEAAGVAADTIKRIREQLELYNATPVKSKGFFIPGGKVGGFVMHDGGVVPGPKGADVPIIAQAGETIIPAGHRLAGAGGSQITMNVSTLDPNVIQLKLREALEWARRGG